MMLLFCTLPVSCIGNCCRVYQGDCMFRVTDCVLSRCVSSFSFVSPRLRASPRLTLSVLNLTVCHQLLSVCLELAKCVPTHCVSSFSLVSPGLRASPRRALSFELNCVSLVIECVLEWLMCVLSWQSVS